MGTLSRTPSPPFFLTTEFLSSISDLQTATEENINASISPEHLKAIQASNADISHLSGIAHNIDLVNVVDGQIAEARYIAENQDGVESDYYDDEPEYDYYSD